MGFVPAQPRAAAQSSGDDARYRTFQANLLSLISHELRTPLTSVISVLGILDDAMGDPSGLPSGPQGGEGKFPELIGLARKNAQKLHHALMTLLDLASIDAGTMKARIREVDLPRILSHRVKMAVVLCKTQSLEIEMAPSPVVSSNENFAVALADPQRVARAIDLCFEVIAARAEPRTKIEIDGTSHQITWAFELRRQGSDPSQPTTAAWDQAWSHSLAGFHSGVGSPASAFSGILQSEAAFLSRAEEGLGSELLLIHELARVHEAKFTAKREGHRVTLQFVLPQRAGSSALEAVLTSRAYHINNELEAVALVLFEVDQNLARAGFERLRKLVFRSSDAVYRFDRVPGGRERIALVLDDLKSEDIEGVLERIVSRWKDENEGIPFSCGAAHCPGDTTDPTQLIELASMRMLKRG